jgi:acylglycerol lipase
MALKTMIMKPKTSKKKKKHKQSSASSQPIRAVVCFCHGYTDNVSFAKRIEFQRLCQAGIAFVALEYEGHGRSDGTLGLIHDWELLIDDATSYFSYVTQHNKAFRNVPVFLMGESMGGAVAYCVYNRAPQLFQGVVFVCPMCKISDDMLPPQYVIDFLTWLIGPTGTTSLLGYLPIAPSKQDLSDVTYRVQEKGLMNSRSPLIYDRNPRLATARELIAVTQRISASLHEFRAPFLVLHGKADRVTDPMLSQALYNESPSNDKSIRLYDGMWHALTCGEPNENIDRVFNDIITWILQRAGESENS